LHRSSECLQAGILQDAVAVQSKKFLGITSEIRWQQQQQWRRRPSLLQLKDLALEDQSLWFRRQRPDHQRGVTLELIRCESHPQAEILIGDFRCKAFTQEIGSEKQNLPVLVDHGALKLR
tara:strand:- start:200 stop:559 length:360 start_codon:yes stop_codon:yes gene_type:complete